MSKGAKILVMIFLTAFILSWFFFMTIIIICVSDIKNTVTGIQASSMPQSVIDSLKRIDSNTPYYIFITIFTAISATVVSFTIYVNNKTEKLYSDYINAKNEISDRWRKAEGLDREIESISKSIEDINDALLLYIIVEKIKAKMASDVEHGDKIFDIKSQLIDAQKYAENLYSVPDVIYYEYASLKKRLSGIKNDAGLSSRINAITRVMEKRRNKFRVKPD